MERYEGESEIKSGAKYIQENKRGHEMCNFLRLEGDKVYGHVEPPHGKTIKLERLGADKEDQRVPGILVIWTAREPGTGGLKVVGWYKNATVHRTRQNFDPYPSKEHEKCRVDSYFIEAEGQNTRLLPPDERTISIPRALGKNGIKGGMGRSATWFAADPSKPKGEEVHQFLEDINRLVGAGGLPVRDASEAQEKPPDPDHKTRESAHAKNRILYGPPGTGKTWEAVNHALAIIERKSVESIAEQERSKFDELRADGQIEMVTFHQNFAYEDFVEGIRPELEEEGSGLRYDLHTGVFKRMAEMAEEAAKKEPDQPKRFVLIIDEINRGNIAKIFGELITLIEGSRRIGATDQTYVTLPYSGHTFGVPDNLYIIGTMNTADRSIQQLDTALRRRFEFVEMMPDRDHGLIQEEVEGVNCREMLAAINRRIVALLDREHQIGHTYLFDVKNMDQLSIAFQNRIFPLLQEYFFDDWAKIRAVLGGSAFVQEQKIPQSLLDADLLDSDSRNYDRLPNDHPAWKNPDEYRKIYERANSANAA